MEGDYGERGESLRIKYFNPLPPHGGRPISVNGSRWVQDISIHSLRMEGDYRRTTGNAANDGFQSTPSAWRETKFKKIYDTRVALFQSTPSAWRETAETSRLRQRTRHFNPLPPHGGRLTGAIRNYIAAFISIHSLRMEGDEWRKCTSVYGCGISIHSLRMEGD